jgi:hypothetical protein
MKLRTLPAMIFAFSLTLSAKGDAKLLTADPLTNLPLYPATDSRLHLGNDPTRLPESSMCQSKMEVDFYSVFDSKVDATVAWYGARLTGFKKTHAYASNRSQDTFYNADGTLIVSITGEPGKADENTDTYSLLFARFNPGLSEKAILSMNQQKVACP